MAPTLLSKEDAFCCGEKYQREPSIIRNYLGRNQGLVLISPKKKLGKRSEVKIALGEISVFWYCFVVDAGWKLVFVVDAQPRYIAGSCWPREVD